MNLQPANYYCFDGMYVDLFTAAGPWHLGWPYPSSTPLPLTADGYPASGKQAQTIFSLCGYPSGIYNFSGTGGFTITSPSTNVNSGLYIIPGTLKTENNVTTCQMMLNQGAPAPTYPQPSRSFLFDIANIDAKNPPDHFSLKSAAYAHSSQVITNEFINAFGMFSCYRGWGNFDLGNTNNIGANQATVAGATYNLERNWADRAPPNFFGYRGNCYENQIALCNQAKSDYWLNVPVEATDDWLTGMANLIHKNLDPSLHVYIEPPDECWNSSQQAYGIINPLVKTSGLPGGGWTPFSAYVARMLMHYREVMNPIVGTQARYILAGQFVQTVTVAGGLAWIQHNYGPPSDYIYAIAAAPYASPSAASPYTDVPSLIASMNDSISSIIVPNLSAYSTLAKEYGLKLVLYEWGQSLIPKGDGSDYKLLLSAQLDPGMATIHNNLATAAENAGVDLCMVNDDCDGWDGLWGYWGLITNLAETGGLSSVAPPPKYTACVALAKNGAQLAARIPPAPAKTAAKRHATKPAPAHH
jgi:hypothetical protein